MANEDSSSPAEQDSGKRPVHLLIVGTPKDAESLLAEMVVNVVNVDAANVTPAAIQEMVESRCHWSGIVHLGFRSVPTGLPSGLSLIGVIAPIRAVRWMTVGESKNWVKALANQLPLSMFEHHIMRL